MLRYGFHNGSAMRSYNYLLSHVITGFLHPSCIAREFQPEYMCRSCSCPSNSPSNSGPRASPGRQLLVIPKGFWLRIFHKFCRAMENPPIFHGKINYFDWAMFNIAMLHVTIFVSQDLSKIWSLVAFFDNGDPTPGEVQKHTQCLVSGKISEFFIEYPLVI